MNSPTFRSPADQRDRPVSQPVASDPARRAGLRVLVVEGERALRDGCVSFFQASGCDVAAVRTPAEALDQVRTNPYDLILVDLDQSGQGGELVRALNAVLPSALVVVTTGSPGLVVEAGGGQTAAWDYLLKPFTPEHLEVLLGRATHVVRSGRTAAGRRSRTTPAGGLTAVPATPPVSAPAVPALPAAPAAPAIHPLGRTSGASTAGAVGGPACVGSSPTFRRAVELAVRVAPSDASVMVFGESGTGKEVIAQLIHRHSRRAEKRLVPVNCAALPDALLESEMLGHRRGAFTGADRDKVGLLETAHGGTFFLDELTEMSPRLQAKLLRVVQDGAVRRVGSEQTDAVVDVRFVSATNVEPHEAVTRGQLRKDLFYRLRVVLIKLPPLRERPEDVPLLAEHFLGHYWAKFRGTQHALPRFTSAATSFLASRPWNGNVRELQNVVEHLAVMAQPGGSIRPDDVPLYDEPVEAGGELTIPKPLLEQDYYPARDQLVAEFDRVYLSRLVGRAGGNMSKAARLASIDRTTLYRLVERYGLNGRSEGESPDVGT